MPSSSACQRCSYILSRRNNSGRAVSEGAPGSPSTTLRAQPATAGAPPLGMTSPKANSKSEKPHTLPPSLRLGRPSTLKNGVVEYRHGIGIFDLTFA